MGSILICVVLLLVSDHLGSRLSEIREEIIKLRLSNKGGEADE